MSEYATGRTAFTDRQLLVQAAADCAITLEQHAEPTRLYGWLGDQRGVTAELVIPRRAISGASNDMGFTWNPAAREGQGAYDVLISDYDQGYEQADGRRSGPGSKLLERLKVAYAVRAVEKLHTARGLKLQNRVDTGRTVVLTYSGSR